MSDTIYVPVKPTTTFGWQYNGEEIPDAVILGFAKGGWLIEHISNEDNDYDGAYCRITNPSGEHHEYTTGEWVVFTVGYLGSYFPFQNRLRWVRDWDADSAEDTVTRTTLRDALGEIDNAGDVE